MRGVMNKATSRTLALGSLWMTNDHMALEVRPCDTRTLPKVLPSDGTGNRAAAAAETAPVKRGIG